MKVLYVTPSFFPATTYGGPTESSYRLARALAEDGACEIDVLTTDANGPERLKNLPANRLWVPVPGLQVRYCRRTWCESFSIEMMLALPAAIRAADVVHLLAVYSAPTIPTLGLCRLLGKPVVWSPRGALQRWAGTRRRLAKLVWEIVCRMIAPKSLTIHATSEEELVSSAHRFPRADAEVIPNGVVLPPVVTDHRRSEFNMVFLGRLDPIKGVENLIAACDLLRISRQWQLTVAGTGTLAYQNRLDEQTRAARLTDRVRRIGPLASEDKAKFFAEASVLILPSHSENFGLVVAEALAHGVPVIASKGTPWSKVLEFGCGLWVDNNPMSLSNAISVLARSDLGAMGKRGRAWMERDFSWSSIALRFASVYNSVGDVARVAGDAGAGDRISTTKANRQ